VLVIELSSGPLWSLAEWPVSLDVVDTWTDKTDLAADSSVITLLALTPAEDGVLQADSGTPAAAQLPGGVRLRLRRRHPRHHLRRYPPLRPR
jgi:hypothetical protein